ncbi:DUF1697 domain-containing protein [Geomonas sp. Red32]|uniref:DUF1697 domain-containing protein n=1 Tax=Geomonas sp. Red32 TaxID=2912856 RepID=UPI00202CCC74|nr:DUF1697 domain-containing protein [Geomonas sp. Red32]MCM0082369.1 DUF1697 domain-containing protein [Geomonas sp. Red32]
MQQYVALFRGINVGGSNILPMKELAALLEAQGLQQVVTYIQSGNVVFESEEADKTRLCVGIRSAVKDRHGFDPFTILLETSELEQAMAANPFSEAVAAPNTLHLFFLAAAPMSPNMSALEKLRGENERYALQGAVFYLHAPDGIGKSKLAANSEKLLGVPATSRNWRTVMKLLELTQRSSKPSR